MMVGQWHNEDKKHQVLFSVLSPRVFGASCRCLVVAKYYVEIYHPSQILVLMAQKSETSAVSQSSKDLTHAADLDDVCVDGQVGPDRQQPPPPPGAWWPHRWVTCHMSPPCMTLSTNSLCHEFFIPSQPGSQARRLVQPRTSLCLRWLQTGKCLQLSHISKSIREAGALPVPPGVAGRVQVN